MGRSISALLVAVLSFAACIPIDIRPRVIRDPARTAVGPERFRDDEHDRWSIGALRESGADFPDVYFLASADSTVVREALRATPPPVGRARRLEHANAVTLILRRRPQAAYVALLERMSLADPSARAAAVWMFADLDARENGSVDEGFVPPWSGPEREAALARIETLLFTDPDAGVRFAAASAFERGIGGPRRPTWDAVLGLVQREQDLELYEALHWLLATREAPAVERIDAAVRWTRDWQQASRLLTGLMIEENRHLLESAYRRGPDHFRSALLTEVSDLAWSSERPLPWLEGIVLMALNDPDPEVRESGAHLSRALGTPSPAVLARLRALRSSSPWAGEALKELGE